MSLLRVILATAAGALWLALPTSALSQPFPAGAECGTFNGWVSGYGRVTQVVRRKMTVQWEIATDGTLFLGRHAIRVTAGCNYWKIVGRPITEAAPAVIVLRTPTAGVFRGGVRPRAGQIISFLAWRATSPLPDGIGAAQVRRIYVTGAATSGAALTG